MEISGFDFGGFIFGTIVLSLLFPFVITIGVIVTIVWAIRRRVPGGRVAAVAELRARFARGEIDQSEFQARLDALNRDG